MNQDFLAIVKDVIEEKQNIASQVYSAIDEMRQQVKVLSNLVNVHHESLKEIPVLQDNLKKLSSDVGVIGYLTNINCGKLANEKKEITPQAIIKCKLENLNLPKKAHNCLKRFGINTVLDLVSKTEGEFLVIPGCGPFMRSQIYGALSHYGLSIGMESID